jgi:MFS family permease
MSDQANVPVVGRSSWAVLHYRDFRLMYGAQFVSATGSSVLLAAVNWHIWSITHDKLALGLVGLVRVLPIIALSLLGGVVSDAVDRRRLLIVTQFMALLFAGALALAALSGFEPLFLIYLLTAALSGLGAFGSPAQSALLPSLVPAQRVGDAGRVNVVLFTTTAVFGPLVASGLYALAGPGLTYSVSALAIIPMVVALFMIRPVPVPTGAIRSVNLDALKEGLNFVWRDPLLRSSMLLDFFATFFASAMALLPVYADQILKVGLTGYGVLGAAPFVGSALGAIGMAHLGNRVKRQGEAMLVAVGVYGLATIAFGVSQSFFISLIALAVTGFSDSVSASVRNAMRQILTPSRLRGRMQSVMMIFFQGGPQLGEFEAGALAQATSAPFSVVTGGIGTLIAVALMAASIPVLRAYRERPEAILD